MTARHLAGWQGARYLLLFIAFAIALPVVFGTGRDATRDWSAQFIGLVFVALPALSLAHIGLTVRLVWQLSGRQRAIEVASLLVSVGYLMVLANLKLVIETLRALR